MPSYIVCSTHGYVEYDGTEASDLTVVGVAENVVNREMGIERALESSPMSRDFWDGKDLMVYALAHDADGYMEFDVQTYQND